ncbi:MAG: oligosaccharide flippase family protein [Saprospiraceae bacterium]|nr:oligosaccharide flippase family protein [Saprospiraceae bacterium]MDW8230020.1 oligosaccharide flippase family protein [Saprospiraceae bacterium]
MQREFLLNLLLLVLINLLVKPLFIFGVELGVQNRLPLGDYGLYFTLLNFAYLFQIIGDFGLQAFNNRHVSQHPHLVGKYLPVLLTLKVLLSALYVLVALVAAHWAGYEGRAVRLLLILLGNQVLAQGILFLRSNLSGLGHYRLDSALSSLDKLLMLLTCGALLWVAPPAYLSAEAFAWSQTLALGLTLLVVGVVLRSKTHVPFRLPRLASRRWRGTLAVLFRESFPYAMVILLMSAYTRLDAVLLERLLPDGRYHADVYAGAYRLLDAANMLGYLFASLLLPMFARMLARREDVRPLAGLAFRLIWAGAVALVLLVFLARADFIRWMMPERADAYRWETLGLLMLAFVPISATHIFSTLLTADGQLLRMSRFFAAAIALDVALDLWLIPRYQALGAAGAAVCTQVFVAASLIALSFRRFGWRVSARDAWPLLAYGAVLCVWGALLFEMTGWPTWSKMAAFGAGALVAAWLFQLLPNSFPATGAHARGDSLHQ